MIKYISTRETEPVVSFRDVVLTGLASDGGLYVPDSIPQFAPHALAAMAALPYTELALRVMQPFIGNAIPEKDLRRLIEDAYKNFRHPDIAPLKKLGENEYLLELFHGPTLAFKDFALQFLGRVLEYFLERNHQELTVIGATSGDTGSAAIEGCRGRKHIKIFILYPNGRVSDVQRRQMTTVTDKNVFALPIEGDFDKCQNHIKLLFKNAEFRKKKNLTAVNSINWARILAQIPYYFYAALKLGAPGKHVSFSVPTGNFGDIYAGYIAKQMGLPVDQLIIATNSNDILKRCLVTGKYSMEKVVHTLSPSMDIQVSSNFERLLFDLYGHNAAAAAEVKKLMDISLRKIPFMLSKQAHMQLQNEFAAGKADDTKTLDTIKSVYKETGELLDPHTAVGVAVGRECHDNAGPTLITLATAHPAKFPDAIKQATGVYPALPTHLADLMTHEEKIYKPLDSVDQVQAFIEKHS